MYDSFPHLFLKALRRKVYPFFFKSSLSVVPDSEQDLQKSNDIIFNTLSASKPCMIGRFGAVEMSVIANYLAVKRDDRSIISYIQGKNWEWWWNKRSIEQLKQCAGVWPASIQTAMRFSERQIEDSKEIDILGSWLPGEFYLNDNLNHAQKVQLFNLEPFFAERPWTRVLKGKTVLVIHPFAETIVKQYLHRAFLFDNPEILPDFNLLTYKAVQSIGGGEGFRDWFEALEFMEKEIELIDFDIAIIGCGAYGLSLAAYIKRMGKKAVHLGGVTQLLFGIKGKRWDVKEKYNNLYNDYWCRPDIKEKPFTANKVEGGCYW